MKPYFITTAIDYTNGAPHIGHAYEKVLGDALARYQRQRGHDVFFLTGVDQHGQKVQQAAEKQDVSPQEFTDTITQLFLHLWEQLSISYDQWAATTEKQHRDVVQKILTDLASRDWLYKASYQGYYSVRQEQFLTDKERNEAGEFGSEWGEVVFLEEENWYFRLSRCKEWLTQFLERSAHFVTPDFRKSELQNAAAKIAGDLCISRPKNRLSWGIELPFDSNFVTYVWFDALINYISFAGYAADEKKQAACFSEATFMVAAADEGQGVDGAQELNVDKVLEATSTDATKSIAAGAEHKYRFSELWPCNHHLIGKDIMIPAHGIYWPCMLHAIGFSDDQMPQLLVHGFWNLGGEKMSKSLGNSVDPKELTERYGPSALRYYLMRDIVMGRDADFSEERLVNRYNTELSNGLGNLLQRTLSMVHRYRTGRPNAVTLPEECLQHAAADVASVKQYCEQMESSQVHAALETMVALIYRANAFVDTTAPWKLAKDPTATDRLDAVLITLLQSTRVAASLLLPIVPVAAREMLQQLALEPLSLIGEISIPALPEKYLAGQPTPIFPRIVVEE